MTNNLSPKDHWFRRTGAPLIIIGIAAFISVPTIISSIREMTKDIPAKKNFEESFRSEKDIIEENIRAGREAFAAHEYYKAVSLFRNGAEKGDARSQGYLGIAYMMLDDDPNGIYWLRKSAENGYPPAQYNLGICYNWRIGTIGNADEAEYWLRKAEKNGIENALERALYSKRFLVE